MQDQRKLILFSDLSWTHLKPKMLTTIPGLLPLWVCFREGKKGKHLKIQKHGCLSPYFCSRSWSLNSHCDLFLSPIPPFPLPSNSTLARQSYFVVGLMTLLFPEDLSLWSAGLLLFSSCKNIGKRNAQRQPSECYGFQEESIIMQQPPNFPLVMGTIPSI